MQRNRRDNINNIDLFVVGDAIKILVAVNVRSLEIVLSRPRFRFLRMAGHDAREVTLFCLLQSGRKLASGIPTQAEQRNPELALFVPNCFERSTTANAGSDAHSGKREVA